MEEITLTGIDLSKNVFYVWSENHAGRLICRKKLSRIELGRYIAKLPQGSEVAMESCGQANYWGRRVVELGLRVAILPTHHVKSHLVRQKNDYNDAEAICKAAREDRRTTVSLKTDEQMNIQSLHRIRERLVTEKTALINQIRGLAMERGYIIPQGISQFNASIRQILAADEQSEFLLILEQLWEEYGVKVAALVKITKQIEKLASKSSQCQAVMKLPGVGKITSSILVAHIGTGKGYKNGRCFAASIGLVPRQFTTGGVIKLGSITKRGDPYIRKLLVHGARAAVRTAMVKQKTDAASLWVRSLRERRGNNQTAVALANKTARQAWAILAGKKPATFINNDAH